MTSIIHLIFTIADIGPLDISVINEVLTTMSNYEVIVCHLADHEGEAGSMCTSQEVTE